MAGAWMFGVGTKSTRKLLGSGTFRCPQCGPQARYEKRRAQRWKHVMGVPVIPVEECDPYVECRECGSTFVERVLTKRYGRSAQLRAEFERAAGLVMAKMILADGRIEEREKATLRSVLERISGASMDDAFIDALVAKAKADTRSAEAIAARFAGSLNASGAELVVKASLMIAVADGDLAAEELRLLRGIAEALGMSAGQYREVYEDVTGAPCRETWAGA
jgi:tellurite resistance protein